MKLTCEQMEILLSFYIENELSPCLKQQVEEHLRECKTCTEKYGIFKDLFEEMQNSAFTNATELYDDGFTKTHTKFDTDFNTKLSAYIDNELSNEDNIKIKKIAITNRAARKELEDSYNIRRLMTNSFNKSKAEAKEDYVRSVLKQLELTDEASANFHPAVRLLVVFTLIVIAIAAIILISIGV